MLIAFMQLGPAQRRLEQGWPDPGAICAYCGKNLGKYAWTVVFERGKPFTLCPEHQDEYVPTEEIIEYYFTPERAREIREQDARMDRFTAALAKRMVESKEEIIASVFSEAK